MITAHTRTLAIIGDPIEHSLTPRIQNAALREVGADIVNVAFHVAPERLEATVRGAQAMRLLGLMVTIPHKEGVLPFCDELDESARLMGAANLLHFRDDGCIVGHSSDGWAAVRSLEEEGAKVRNARIAILGGGGSARSLALTFGRAGAREIVVMNRTVARAESIVEELSIPELEARAMPLDASTLAAILPKTDLLVNATSLGMTPNLEVTPVPDELLHDRLTVYDIVYNPLETRLLREARQAGARAVDGLGMLIYTNVYAVKTCADLDVSPHTMRQESLWALG